MVTSQNGLDLIKKFEGFSATPYVCAGGKLTIGYGHVLLPDEQYKEPITEDLGNALLRSDVRKFERAVNNLVTVELTQNQFDALVSFTFNLGPDALKRSTLLDLLNSGDYKCAAAQFPRWNRAGGKVLAGLARRREEEAKLFLEGVNNNDTDINHLSDTDIRQPSID